MLSRFVTVSPRFYQVFDISGVAPVRPGSATVLSRFVTFQPGLDWFIKLGGTGELKPRLHIHDFFYDSPQFAPISDGQKNRDGSG